MPRVNLTPPQEEPSCNHFIDSSSWEFISDLVGDGSDCSSYKCRLCGEHLSYIDLKTELMNV